MKIKTKFNKYWFGFFLVKLFYMFFAVFIYSKLTTLGDTSRWMDGFIEVLSINILINSTLMMDFLGGITSLFLGSIFGNLPFLIMAFYGIYYSLSKIKLSNNELITALFLLSLPSFGIWSSISGKEAVGVFFMGILLGYLIDMVNEFRYKPKFIELISFYLLFVFKPQYSIAIISLIIYIILARKFKAYGKLILLLFHITLTVIFFYIFKEIINELSFIIPSHFNLDAGSTRENTIWVKDYDVFFNAPYGMFIGFWGPTITEVIERPIQMIVFFENILIFSFLLYFLIKIIFLDLRKYKMNIFITSLILISIFWLLFVHYPFGVLNPGSAIRYRENFYGFLIVWLFYLYTKRFYYDRRINN